MPKNDTTNLTSSTQCAGDKAPRKGTKIEAVLRLLKRQNGASISDLQKVTGWQPHSVRATLTGLRKKGHPVTRSKDAKGTSVYHVQEAS